MHFGTEAQEVHQCEGAESVEEELLTEETVPEFGLVFAETALLLVTREVRTEVKGINGLISNDNFCPGELHRDVKGFNDCQRSVNDSRD